MSKPVMHQRQNRQNQIMRRLMRDNRGSAMITALIVGFVVMVFCLSLLMVAYSLFAQSARQTADTQCKLLAQSSLEQVGAELVDSNSELNQYLGELIEKKYWISLDEAETMENLQPGMVTKVSLLLKDATAEEGMGQFQILLDLEYSLNEADDEEKSGDEADDNALPTVPGAGNAGNASEQTGNGSISIHAVITCRKGDGTESDHREYSIETDYPAVSF